MDDMASKIQEILSDKESMQQLNELAQMFSSSESSNDNNQNNQTPQQENIMPDFDFSKLIKIKDIMNRTTDDKTSGFLIALKPLLKKDKQDRIDKAVKIIRLLAVWEILKESGMLNDFLQ